MVEHATFVLTRSEAEELFDALNKTREALVLNIGSVNRKLTWRESEKAMAVADFRKRLVTIEEHMQRIGTAFNIGGW
jgi:hypothetical protein